MMMKRIFVLLLICAPLCSATTEYRFWARPGITAINTGLGPIWSYHGGAAGITLRRKHSFSLDMRLMNDVENTEYYYDSITHAPSWRDDIHHYGNLYLSYARQWHPFQQYFVALGISAGFKYAEYDRNWDTTVTTRFRRGPDAAVTEGKLHLRHEAEGRFTGFGGPFLKSGFGVDPLFLTVILRLNMGILENWGYFSAREADVSEVFFKQDYSVGDIEIARAGWHGNTGSRLFSKKTIMPELTFALTVLF
ncbi:MAG: hypothetical protein ACQEQV_09090 [Fibrobacterota bacterium]